MLVRRPGGTAQATRWPGLDGDGEVNMEIRQVFEAEDFGPEFRPELREAEERLRAHVAAKP
jgi:hypothetical protein